MARKVFPENPVTEETQRSKSLLDPWYVTGFCDGECAFTYSLQSNNLGLSIYFNLKLHERDLPLLQEIQSYFGNVGRIYHVKDPRPTAGPKAYYRVTNLDDLQVIIKHFDRYPPRGWKANGYAIWRRMVTLKYDHYGHPPHDEILELAHELSRLNRSNATAWLRKAEDRRMTARVIPEEHVSEVTDRHE